MTTMTEEVVLDAPIGRAFDYVDRQELQLRWMLGVERIEHLNTGKVDPDRPLGLKFVQHVREGNRANTYQGEVILHEKPTRLSIRLSHRMFILHVSYHFRKLTETRTSLHYQLQIQHTHWLGRLMGGLYSGKTQKLVRQQLATLQTVVKEEAAKQ